MYEEISTLLGNLAKALDMEPEAVATLLEQGAIQLRMEVDEDGNACVGVTYGEGDDRRVARVYRDRIRHLTAGPPGAPDA
jgi:hypothetical protein